MVDVDTCVCKDLSELFNVDLKDNYIAGVVSPGYYFNENFNCRRLHIPSMRKYLNAGVLLINLKQIREDNMTKKFIDLTKRNYQSQDQDILNVACYEKILTLPPKYNAMVLKLKENNPRLKELYKEEEIIEAKTKPHIIHYANKKKPWNSRNVYMENYWWNIANKTPYIDNFIRKDFLQKLRYKKSK